MPKFRLMQISPNGRCKEIAYNQNIEQLKATCVEVMKIFPDVDYGIVDDTGYFIWPEKFVENNNSVSK